MSFNTASGRYCCNAQKLNTYIGLFAVSIPQAVGTVATLSSFSLMAEKMTQGFQYRKRQVLLQHIQLQYNSETISSVSIPQAVGTVATVMNDKIKEMTLAFVFQYRKRQVLLQQRGLGSQYLCGPQRQFWKTSNRKR